MLIVNRDGIVVIHSLSGYVIVAVFRWTVTKGDSAAGPR